MKNKERAIFEGQNLENNKVAKKIEQESLNKRKCTDMICFLIWLSFWFLILIFSISGYYQGDLKNFFQPYDSDGQACGRGKAEEFDYLYITNPFSKDYSDKMLCVKDCPINKDVKIDCFPNTDITSCDIETYKTRKFASRICIPMNQQLSNNVIVKMNINIWEENLSDIKDSWPILISLLILTIIISFLFYFIVEYCASLVIFIMLLSSLAGLIIFGFYNWNQYQKVKENSIAKENEYEQFKIIAIICWVLSGVFLLIITCLYNQIRTASQMISIAADFVNERRSALLIPLLLILFSFIFLVWWLVTFVFIFSTGELRYDEGDLFGDMVWTDTNTIAICCMIMALLWFISFIQSSNNFIIACKCIGWYFFRDDRSKEKSILTYFKWAWYFHLGTLAFGSFLIALLWMILLILKYIYNKVKNINQTASFIVKCASCFVSCFERLMQFVNTQAYIQTALKNLNYCQATREALKVTIDNFLTISVLNGIINLFLFIGTVFISCLITIVGHQFLKFYGEWKGIQFDTVGPLIIIFLMAMIVTLLFNNVLDISANTMLQCYIYEDEHNKQFLQNQYMVPQKLKNIILSQGGYAKVHDQNQPNHQFNLIYLRFQLQCL